MSKKRKRTPIIVDETSTDGKIKEHLLDLGNGMSIWKVHLDWLREQDKNARVMSPERFKRLSGNIKKDKRLESLPLCAPIEGRNEFQVISGHHRTRAARAANVMEVPVLVFNDALPKDYIKAKQLAHNSIQGDDDEQTLLELLQEIESIDARIESGVTEVDHDFGIDRIKPDEMLLKLDFEVLHVLFLPENRQEFLDIIDGLTRTDEVKLLLVERFDAFEPFKKALHEVSRDAQVRNIAGIMTMLARYAQSWIRAVQSVEKGKPEKAMKLLEGAAEARIKRLPAQNEKATMKVAE